MTERILIHAEIIDGKINPVCLELLSKIHSLLQGRDFTTAFSVAGSGIDDAIKRLKESGVDTILALDDTRLPFHPDFACAALMAAVNEFKPDILLIGATAFGEEIAPTMGLKLNTGVAAHCMDIQLKEDGMLAYMVPAFGGKVIGEIFIPAKKPQIASIKPGIFKKQSLATKKAEIHYLEASVLVNVTSGIQVIEVHNKTVSSGEPLEKADLVLCGGYGIGEKENWDNMEELAAVLNGAVGCTRPAVDCGFTEDETIMIGTSGKSVRPSVYIGFGISGAMHHLCGIKDSGLIISVNHDENADIFKSSDYYAIADSKKIISKLLELIR